MTPSKPAQTIVSIQALRGVAAAVVVVFHYVSHQESRGQPIPDILAGLGSWGVDVFFVISGFIMSLAVPDGSRTGAGTFLWRRLLRIAPLYWTLTAIALLSAVVVSPHGITANLGTRTFLSSMVFLPYSEVKVVLDPAAANTYILPMAWTLTYEWYFYLLFSLTIALKVSAERRLVLLVAWFGVTTTAGFAFRPDNLVLQVATSPLSFEFLLGCGIALLRARAVRLNGYVATLLAVVGLVLCFTANPVTVVDRVFLFGAGSALLVAAAALYAGHAVVADWAPLRRLGDISYSLYLSHFFALSVFVMLQARVSVLDRGFSAAAVLGFGCLSVIVAELCYRSIEQPARFIAVRRARSNPVTD